MVAVSVDDTTIGNSYAADIGATVVEYKNRSTEIFWDVWLSEETMNRNELTVERGKTKGYWTLAIKLEMYFNTFGRQKGDLN